jgi:SAM-dependent methyltransferase
MNESVHDAVRRYYGEVLKRSEDLKTNACCASGAPPAWVAERLAEVHPEVSSRFYGCGFPIPGALEGATIVDLGCGTGRDVYVLSQLVGERGRVVGVDMTAAQLDVARATEDWHRARFGYATSNVRFEQGYIEDLASLGIDDASVDVVVSNCVVNLSPRKDLVMDEVWRVLKPGGEFYFSDVFVDRRLPPDVMDDELLHSECLGGALYEHDFVDLARSTGFVDPRELTRGDITIQNAAIERRVGAARFVSITWRLFKLEGLEPRCEDYGQVATYRGTVNESPARLVLDDHHVFEAGRPERVCGNTAAMLDSTRYAAHFDVVGDRRTHYGIFDCGETMAAAALRSRAEPGGAASCC